MPPDTDMEKVLAYIVVIVVGCILIAAVIVHHTNIIALTNRIQQLESAMSSYTNHKENPDAHY